MVVCFLIPVANCVSSTHQKVRQSTKSTSSRFYIAFVRMSEESSQTCATKNFLLHLDGALAYSACVIQAFLVKNVMTRA